MGARRTTTSSGPRVSAAGGRHPAGTAAQPWRAWVLAARLPTLAAAVAPVLVGTAAAAGAGRFSALPFLAALVATICIQVATNFANDA
ncbi:MAG: 1,4-dihydroxy-2-naphthoate polyprenyltransferase, partial [bacterium]